MYIYTHLIVLSASIGEAGTTSKGSSLAYWEMCKFLFAHAHVHGYMATSGGVITAAVV